MIRARTTPTQGEGSGLPIRMSVYPEPARGVQASANRGGGFRGKSFAEYPMLALLASILLHAVAYCYRRRASEVMRCHVTESCFSVTSPAGGGLSSAQIGFSTTPTRAGVAEDLAENPSDVSSTNHGSSLRGGMGPEEGPGPSRRDGGVLRPFGCKVALSVLAPGRGPPAPRFRTGRAGRRQNQAV